MINIPFSKVVCDGNELKYVRRVIESGWLTTASVTLEFERKFAEAVGAKHACAVNSCTSALHLALDALGVGVGDKVFVPTLTFTATAEVVRYLGADPIILDVDPDTGLITREIVGNAIARHKGVKALMAVHYAGQPVELTEERGSGLLDLCRENGIRVVEDAAHAFPASLRGRKVGTISDLTCFSFYANKTITTGEGGMITTDSDELHKRIRLMRLHGIDRDVWSRFTAKKPSWEYDVIAPGYKYNMADVNAAIGLAQLERAVDLRERRQRCADFYFRRLQDLQYVKLPKVHSGTDCHAWHLFPIVLSPECPIGRDELIEKLAEVGVGTSVHYKPLHRLKYYRERYELVETDFPNAEEIWRGCLSLPIHAWLSQDDQEYIINSIRKILRAC